MPGAPHDRGVPIGLRAAAGAAGVAELAGVVVVAAAGAAAPAPAAPWAREAAARHFAEGRDAGAHTVVADLVAPHVGGAADPRRRGAIVESAARDLASVRAARATDRRRLGRSRHLGHART